jgi:hypothetical protein
MNSFLNGLYVLLTSRVPLPKNTMFFGVGTLSAYTLLAPRYAAFTELGLILPVLCAMFGYLVVVALNAPRTVERLRNADIKRIGPHAFAIPFALCVAGVFAPSLEWAQHFISILLGGTALVFVSVTVAGAFKADSNMFGDGWNEGKRNAANWHVARLVALMVGNEAVARTGTPADWVIAMSIGPILLHYLMYWTIIVTHPYEETGDDTRDL